MKILVAVGVVAVVLGAVFWLLYLGDRPASDDGDHGVATRAEHAGRSGEERRGWEMESPERDDKLGEHGRVIEAIAHGLSQDGGAVLDSGVDLGPQGPLTYDEAKLERKLALRAGSRQLMPVVRDCLKRMVKEQPSLASPRNKATLTVEGTREEGGRVTRIELIGPDGPLTAPTLEGCIRASTTDLLLAVPPVPGGGPEEPATYSFPLISP